MARSGPLDLDFDRKRVREVGTDREWQIKRLWRSTQIYSDRFTILFHRGLGALSRARLSPCAWRVLMALLERLDFREWRQLPQGELSVDLAIGVPAVSKSVRRLVALGIVERETRKGVVVLRLNADVGWRGSASGWHAHQDRRRRAGKAGSPSGGPVERVPAEARARRAGEIEDRLARDGLVDVAELTELIAWLRERAAAGEALSERQRSALRRFRTLPAKTEG